MGVKVVTCGGAGCGAEIVWVLTEGGIRMAAEPGPRPEGTLVAVRDDAGRLVERFSLPVVHILTSAELPAQEPALVPHWTTCPADPRGAARRRRIARRGEFCLRCRLPMDPVLTRQNLLFHPMCDPEAIAWRAWRSALVLGPGLVWGSTGQASGPVLQHVTASMT